VSSIDADRHGASLKPADWKAIMLVKFFRWCAISTPVEPDRYGHLVSTLVTWCGPGTYGAASHFEGGESRSHTYAGGNIGSCQGKPRPARWAPSKRS
jgi:hypothetical protein